MSVTCDKTVFFSDTPVSSINNTDHHDITEILLRVALNTITLTLIVITMNWLFCFFTSCWFPTSWSNDNLNWNTTEVLCREISLLVFIQKLWYFIFITPFCLWSIYVCLMFVTGYFYVLTILITVSKRGLSDGYDANKIYETGGACTLEQMSGLI